MSVMIAYRMVDYMSKLVSRLCMQVLPLLLKQPAVCLHQAIPVAYPDSSANQGDGEALRPLTDAGAPTVVGVDSLNCSGLSLSAAAFDTEGEITIDHSSQQSGWCPRICREI